LAETDWFVEWNIEADAFIDAFGVAEDMIFLFASGDESDWSMKLNTQR
jgi:hypothetical protein